MTDVVVRRIEEQFVDGKPLGRHVEHDPRSRGYAFAEEAAQPTIRRVIHRRLGGPFDQGNLGSCTGNAMAGAVNTLPLHFAHERILTETDAVAIYAAATKVDEYPGAYPPDDTGSSGLAVCKVAKAKGLIGDYRHAFSIEEAVTALLAGPVITGVDWYEGFDHPDVHGLVAVGGQVRGGHEIEALGIEPAHSGDPFLDALVALENSWGPSYGRKGRFYWTVRTWGNLLSAQGDVTVPLPVAA